MKKTRTIYGREEESHNFRTILHYVEKPKNLSLGKKRHNFELYCTNQMVIRTRLISRDGIEMHHCNVMYY